MSLLSLADRSAAAARATADDTRHESTRTGGEEPPPPPPAADSALQRLVEFIPVETVAAFWIAVPAAVLLAGEAVVAKVGVFGAAAGGAVALPVAHPNDYDWVFFLVLLVATPALLLVQFLGKVRRTKADPLPPWRTWPWWRMFASAVAFVMWSWAVPGNPFLHSAGWLMTAWLVALLVSAFIVGVDKIVNPPDPAG